MLSWLPIIENDLGFQFSTDFKNKFNFDDYQAKLIIIEDEKEVQSLTLEKIMKIKDDSDYEQRKENFFHELENRPEIVEYRNFNTLDPDMKELCSKDDFFPSYQKFFECFQGKLNFFNLLNILAFLFSYGLFLLSFGVPFLFFYFFYALIYVFLFLDEEQAKEENKFLLALYKTLKAVLFLNLQDFLKIIPILCLLGSFFFSSSFFFGNNEKFTPIIYDVKEKMAMNLYRYGDTLKKLLEGKIIKSSIDSRYEFPYLLSPEMKTILHLKK